MVLQDAVGGHRNVSRLGPLAGAGVMASAMQRTGSGAAKTKAAATNGERHRRELRDAGTEPGTEPTTR